MLTALKVAVLTAKCKIGKRQTQYLGFQVGRGEVWPERDKVEVIKKTGKTPKQEGSRKVSGDGKQSACLSPSLLLGNSSPLTDVTK